MANERDYMTKSIRGISIVLFTAVLLSQGYSQNLDSIKTSAEAGDPDAQFDLGCAYLWGEGVDQDDSEAVYWFILSAEQDHIDSQYYLGALLESGRGISQNSHRANQYFSDAAEQGHAYAQYELGYSYMYGRGTAKDPVLAFAWLSIAYATASDLNDRELMHQADSSRQLLALEMSSNDIIEARLKAMNFSPVKQR